jgi:quercetin dioxygenase-like cupin family protein
MTRIPRFLACAFLVAPLLGAIAHGQTTPPAPAHGIVAPAAIVWAPGPPSLPAGAMMAVLTGDPTKEGLFVIRAKLPDGYKVSPHRHPTDEHVTVLKGGLMMGMGEKFDKAALNAVVTGGFFTAPANQPHYVMAKGETIIQVTAMGPFSVTYVNAADDPRTKGKTN